MTKLALLTAALVSMTSIAEGVKGSKPALASLANTEIVLSENNTIILNKSFSFKSVAETSQRAKELDAALPSNERVILVMDSPGGSIDAGLELIENLSSLNRPVTTLSLFSASMGFQAVQGLGERLLVANGTLMSHKASGGFDGEFPGQLDSRYNYYKKRVLRLDQQVVNRTNGKHTLKSYQDLVENEFWCDGEDCVKQGLADRVVKASCDKTLSGTKEVLLGKFMFMGSTVEVNAVMSQCPLITGFLDIKIIVDGQSLFTGERPKTKDQYWQEQNPRLAFDAEKVNALMTRVDELVRPLIEKKKVIKGY